IAAAMSTRCITWPPSSLPNALVCAGSTTSAISEREALTGLPGGKVSAFFVLADGLLVILLHLSWILAEACAARIIRNVNDGTEENAQADTRGVRGQEARRRIFSLRLSHGVHE